MSFRQTWSKNFFVDQFDIRSPSGFTNPQPCNIPAHATIDPATGQKRVSCFMARHTEMSLERMGDWKLRSPINIPSAMPGTKQKILSIRTIGMHLGSKGVTGYTDYSAIKLFADDVQIFEYHPLPHPYNKWTDPPITIEPNESLEGKTELSLWLHQHSKVGLGSSELALHDNQIVMNCEYYNNIPPVHVPVTINVLDQDTGSPIREARVTLKSGARVIADGYTDNNGVKYWELIQTGGYTLRVTASGYYMAESSIEVEEPAVEYDVLLVPIPADPLAWWVLPAVVGGIGIGGLVLLKGAPKMPPIMVVR